MASLRSIITDSKYGRVLPKAEKKTTKIVLAMMYNGQEYLYVVHDEHLIGVSKSNSIKNIGYIHMNESPRTYAIVGVGDDASALDNEKIITAMWKCITS